MYCQSKLLLLKTKLQVKHEKNSDCITASVSVKKAYCNKNDVLNKLKDQGWIKHY